MWKLKAEDESAYEALLSQGAAGWGSSPAQPLHRRVSHLLSVMLRKLMLPSAAAAYDKPTVVGEADVDRLWRENKAAFINQLGIAQARPDL